LINFSSGADYVSQLSASITNACNTSTYRQERFILVHSFGRLSSWFIGPVAFGKAAHKAVEGREKSLTSWLRCERKRRGWHSTIFTASIGVQGTCPVT
jgi:hypothetical protein